MSIIEEYNNEIERVTQEFYKRIINEGNIEGLVSLYYKTHKKAFINDEDIKSNLLSILHSLINDGDLNDFNYVLEIVDFRISDDEFQELCLASFSKGRSLMLSGLIKKTHKEFLITDEVLELAPRVYYELISKSLLSDLENLIRLVNTNLIITTELNNIIQEWYIKYIKGYSHFVSETDRSIHSEFNDNLINFSFFRRLYELTGVQPETDIINEACEKSIRLKSYSLITGLLSLHDLLPPKSQSIIKKYLQHHSRIVYESLTERGDYESVTKVKEITGVKPAMISRVKLALNRLFSY